MTDLKEQTVCRFRLLLLTIAIASASVATYCQAQEATPYPPGVYGLWAVTMPISSSETQCVLTGNGALLYEDQGVVGILLEVPWPSVDSGTNSSNFNWDQMNQRLTEAQLCGLHVALSLSTALASIPPWVQHQVADGTIQYTVNLGTSICPAGPPNCSVPVFWDTVFNNDRVAFIDAAADDIATLPASVLQNIVAVLAQPFGGTTDDWNIPHSTSSGGVNQLTAWQAAGYSTPNMFGTAQTILSAAAAAFPTLSLKLPIQADGTALDGTNPKTGTDVALATQVLKWAYTTFPGRFFAQLNFVNATKSPVNCTSPCALDANVHPQSPYSIFNLIRLYQQQGVGLQDVDGAVNGAAPGNNCRQYGTTPCTPCDPNNPVQYSDVAETTFRIVQSYTPKYWEIWNGDATTVTGTKSTCPITGPEQAGMRGVYSAATTQVGGVLRQGGTPVSVQLSSASLTYPNSTNVVVAVQPTNGQTPTGTINLYDGTTLLTTLSLRGNGDAYWYISQPPNVGTHNITGVYNGDGDNPIGVSPASTLVVAPSQPNISASCWNSSFPFGGSYSCTAYVGSNAGAAPGILGYTVDGVAYTASLINGNARFTVSRPIAGSHSVALNYAAQANFAATGPVAESFSVTPAPTQVQLRPSSYYQSASQPLTLTASLSSWSAGAPTDGSVTFYDGGAALGTANAGATVSFTPVLLSAGMHSFSATYLPGTSGNYAQAASSAVNVQLY